MNERILIHDRIITKNDAVKLEKGHSGMETKYISPIEYASQNQAADVNQIFSPLLIQPGNRE